MQLFEWVIYFYVGFNFFLLIVIILKSSVINETPTKPENVNSFSILIASKNEEQNVNQLLYALSQQKLQPTNIVWVDDHSSDKTPLLVSEWGKKLHVLKLVQLPEGITGKRYAWEEGMKHVSTSLVLTIDADCIPVTETWTFFMLSHWNEKIRLVGGGVFGIKENSIFSKCAYHEHAIVVMLGHIAAMLSFPLYVSGANMLFRKEDFMHYLKTSKLLKSPYGDDTLFMNYLIRRYGKNSVKLINDYRTIVLTYLPDGFSSWKNQRLRWLSKTHMFISSYIFWFTFIILLMDISVYGLLFIMPLKGVILLLIKNLIQAKIFYLTGKKFFNLEVNYAWFLISILFFGVIHFILSLKNLVNLLNHSRHRVTI
ncbi:MAG: glycosyltransferase [Bacteroidales bacterium]|nr:glycosyltransferase [Bacteroidales bacterium]